MRRAAMVVALLLSHAAVAGTHAAETAPGPIPPAPSPDVWVPRTTADIQVLDKVNAASVTITLKVGQVADNASLSITLRACSVRPPDLPQDATAYLDIADGRPGAPGFHGWIFANEPALSMLEHPIYDLRLINCH
jgi:hypothetical protein